MFSLSIPNIKIVENTVKEEYFSGINYYIKEDNHHAHILYYSDDDFIHDRQTSFLFVNCLPKGSYEHYIYIETDQDIKNVISRLQNEILTSANNNSYNFLSNMTPDVQSISDIMKLASRTINNPIALCTPTYEIIEMCDNDIVFIDDIWNETLQTGSCSQKLVEQFETKGITEKVTNREEPVLWSSDIGNTYPQITTKIMYKDELIAYLSVYVVNSDHIGEAFTVVKELVPIFSSILSKSSRYVSDRYQLIKNFVYQLLENNVKDIHSETERLNIQISDYRVVCISDRNNSSIYNYSYYLNILLAENIIGSFYKGKLLLLIEEQSSMHQYIEDLRNKYFSNRYVFFVSEVLHDLEESCKTTNMLLHFANYAFPDQNTVYINDYLHILYVPVHSLFSPAYNRLSGPLHAELKDTLITYIECNYNVSDASKALYIHRNTLLYRLSKIRAVFGIDTNDYLELMNLYIYHKSLTV